MSCLKKLFLFGVSALLFVSISFANETSLKFVAITAIVEHPALDNVKKGVEDELNENGYKQGQNLKLQYLSAQGSSANAAQIAKQFVSNKPDVIVGIATPSAQALAATTKSIPIVFTAVTDPVVARLTSSWNASKTNITGVSDALSLESQINVMLKLKEKIKTVGYIYSPGEVNSTIILKDLKKILDIKKIKLIAVPAQRTSDIPTAAKSLRGKVDIIYSSTDNNVISAYESLVKVANEAKIPLFASDPDTAKRGASAALGMSYYNLGRQAGKIVIRILKGEKAGNIAPQIGEKTALILNKTAAKNQSVEFSKEILALAEEVVD